MSTEQNKIYFVNNDGRVPEKEYSDRYGEWVIHDNEEDCLAAIKRLKRKDPMLSLQVGIMISRRMNYLMFGEDGEIEDEMWEPQMSGKYYDSWI